MQFGSYLPLSKAREIQKLEELAPTIFTDTMDTITVRIKETNRYHQLLLICSLISIAVTAAIFSLVQLQYVG